MRNLRQDYNCTWAFDLAVRSGQQEGDAPFEMERVSNMDCDCGYIKNYLVLIFLPCLWRDLESTQTPKLSLSLFLLD